MVDYIKLLTYVDVFQTKKASRAKNEIFLRSQRSRDAWEAISEKVTTLEIEQSITIARKHTCQVEWHAWPHRKSTLNPLHMQVEFE